MKKVWSAIRGVLESDEAAVVMLVCLAYGCIRLALAFWEHMVGG